MMNTAHTENKLKKHLASKKIDDHNTIELLMQLLDLNPKKRVTAAVAANVSPPPASCACPASNFALVVLPPLCCYTHHLTAVGFRVIVTL